MYRFAVYGKGGIGKSTTCTALSCAFAEKGLKVLQVGCDPKADSTLYLHNGERITPILEVLREKRSRAQLDDLVHEGYNGIMCAESGGPMPGLGCAGRGIAAAFEALRERDAFEILQPDVVIYDVLGDVVCGGFAMPIREGYADHVLIVTSGENMAVYAAANIACAIENFRERGYASLAGVVLNRRNVPNEQEKVEELCGEIRSEIVCDLPRDNRVAQAEESRKPVMEMFPGIPYADEIRRLADYMLTLPEGEDE